MEQVGVHSSTCRKKYAKVIFGMAQNYSHLKVRHNGTIVCECDSSYIKHCAPNCDQQNENNVIIGMIFDGDFNETNMTDQAFGTNLLLVGITEYSNKYNSMSKTKASHLSTHDTIIYYPYICMDYQQNYHILRDAFIVYTYMSIVISLIVIDEYHLKIQYLIV